VDRDQRPGRRGLGHEEELGVTFRPPAQAIGDTVRWLYEAGHIIARQTGRAASR
jgi:hypothetical protein